MKVIASKKAYALFCMRNIVLSPSLPMYIKHFKAFKKACKEKNKPFNPYIYAIRFFEMYELEFKLSVDWNLKDDYYAFNSL